MSAKVETLLYVGAGIAVVMLFDTTIAGVLNPILAPLKLSYS